ncbi:hypothetical protein MT997_23535 [Paenibacillus sp. OVF10]|nr:hypothetical protein MT997_23535 [Paenibacillus sp. OVF10]
MSKGKSDKNVERFDSELEDEYFDAAFDLAFDEAFHQAVSAPSASHTESMQQSWQKVHREINRIGLRKKNTYLTTFSCRSCVRDHRSRNLQPAVRYASGIPFCTIHQGLGQWHEIHYH